MNHQLVPEREIYPYVRTSVILPSRNAYVRAGDVNYIPTSTYQYKRTSNSVTTVINKNYNDTVDTLLPNVNFINRY